MICFFFFNDTATTEIYTLSLHDALPICFDVPTGYRPRSNFRPSRNENTLRSEEHTSELQSHVNLVCRLLLEKKKKQCLVAKRASTRTPERELEFGPAPVSDEYMMTVPGQ